MNPNACDMATGQYQDEDEPKTRQDVEILKHDWLRDPCWDIEETEGFEDYRQELYIFRIETELSEARRELTRYRTAISVFKDIFTN